MRLFETHTACHGDETFHGQKTRRSAKQAALRALFLCNFRPVMSAKTAKEECCGDSEVFVVLKRSADHLALASKTGQEPKYLPYQTDGLTNCLVSSRIPTKNICNGFASAEGASEENFDAFLSCMLEKRPQNAPQKCLHVCPPAQSPNTLEFQFFAPSHIFEKWSARPSMNHRARR